MCQGVGEPEGQQQATHGKDMSEQSVWLHVYDLGPVSKWVLNSWATHLGNSGAFHCGVEVLGSEWCFQANASCAKGDMRTGVTAHKAKSHPRHVYRESIWLGNTPLPIVEVRKLIKQLEESWPAASYHFIRRNCVDFAEVLHSKLCLPSVFPEWPRGCSKGLLQYTPLKDLDTTNVTLMALCGSSQDEMQSCGSYGFVDRQLPGLKRLGSLGNLGSCCSSIVQAKANTPTKESRHPRQI